MLFAPRPCGNSIKKAYLCNAQTKSLPRGSTLLFYRSGDRKAVTAVGIVEDFHRGRSPDVIARFVGNRTVYTYDEICRLCESDVLAIRFRRVSLLESPIELKELQSAAVLRSWPQSITKVNEEALPWLAKRTNLR